MDEVLSGNIGDPVNKHGMALFNLSNCFLLLVLALSGSCSGLIATPADKSEVSPSSFLPVIAKNHGVLITDTPTRTPGTATITPTFTMGTSTVTSTPIATPAPTSTPAATSTPSEARLPFGIQTFGELGDEVARALVQGANIAWARIDLSWGSIEPNAPVGGVHDYRWGGADSSLSGMLEAGVIPVVTIGRAPEWAVGCYSALWDHDNNPSTPSVQFTGGPICDAHLSDWEAFIRALVERYDGDGIDDAPGAPVVRHWEIYNEPDNQLLSYACAIVGGGWGDDLDNDGISDSREYAGVLKRAYEAAKLASTEAQVIFGSVAYERLSQGCFNLGFMDEVLTELAALSPNGNAGDYFDFAGFHQYDFARERWDGALPFNQGVLGKAAGPGWTTGGVTYPSIRGILSAHGVGSKPIVVTEIGLNSNRSATQDEFQARHIVHELVRGMTMWPDGVSLLTVFALREPSFGIVDSAYTPYRAYNAYRTLAEQLGGVVGFEQQLGSSETGSANIQAYRFVMSDGTKKLVLWTDKGCPIKRSGCEVTSNMSISQAHMGVSPSEWTGYLKVTDEYGNVSTIGSGGPSVSRTITQSPIYVEVAPAP